MVNSWHVVYLLTVSGVEFLWKFLFLQSHRNLERIKAMSVGLPGQTRNCSTVLGQPTFGRFIEVLFGFPTIIEAKIRADFASSETFKKHLLLPRPCLPYSCTPTLQNGEKTGKKWQSSLYSSLIPSLWSPEHIIELDSQALSLGKWRESLPPESR